jgi:hypothetical protein
VRNVDAPERHRQHPSQRTSRRHVLHPAATSAPSLRYSRAIDVRRRIAGALAAAGIALALLAAQAKGLHGSALKVGLPQTGQAELLAAGSLPVRLRSRVAESVRVSATLEFRHRRHALTYAATSRLPAGHWRSLQLALKPAGKRILATCPSAHIVMSVQGAKSSAGAERRLQLQPPACARFFGRTAFWNDSVPGDAPLDPDSAAITQDLNQQVSAGFQSGSAPTINTTTWTPPVYTVGAAQPRVRVRLDRPPGVGRSLAVAFASVPLAPHASPSPDTDATLVVWQPATDTLWEFWGLRRGPDGWHARWGGRLSHVARGPGVFPQGISWGASATGLPLVGGLITPQELRRGEIPHALALSIPAARYAWYSQPAQRTDGQSLCAHSPPEGARFRLDPTLDVASLHLPRVVALLARAAQRYGIVVRDRGGSVAFYAQNASSLPGGNPYPALFEGQAPWQLLRSFPWSRLELLQMRLQRMPNPAPLTPPPPDLLSPCT